MSESKEKMSLLEIVQVGIVQGEVVRRGILSLGNCPRAIGSEQVVLGTDCDRFPLHCLHAFKYI